MNILRKAAYSIKHHWNGGSEADYLRIRISARLLHNKPLEDLPFMLEVVIGAARAEMMVGLSLVSSLISFFIVLYATFA